MVAPSRGLACALLVGLIVVAGCGRHLQQTLGPANQRPVVRLETPRVSVADPAALAATPRWSASDADGRVDHFLVTEDVAAFGRETGWTASVERERTLTWRRAGRGAAMRAPADGAGDFRFLAVKAVDDRGAVSEPEYVAFFDENVAPTVTIVSPALCSGIDWDCLPPDFVVQWVGADADGPNGRPAQYKYRLFKRGPGIPWEAWLYDPDSLRRTYAPTFVGWDSISGDSTELRLRGLDTYAEHLFVITALDAEGAYDPVFGWCKNMLRRCVYPPSPHRGPVITVFNESFSYTYPSGGLPDPIPDSWAIPVEGPADVPMTVNWSAKPPQYSSLAGYRWALDIADVHDETARRNRNDVTHWSEWDLATTSVTVDGQVLKQLAPAAKHRLYIEAADEFGLVSLGVVEFRLVASPFDRDLLIVDDTRFKPDMLASTQPPGRTDSLRAPVGPWPTAAELDTFLYAVGGVRWRMTPTGRVSAPGLFHGYRFDTLGTRTGLENPTIPLEVLGRYRHVVWMTDRAGSTLTGPPTSQTTPQTTLLFMSMPNRQNTLANWLKSGGALWALGGGFGNATNSPWNLLGNDSAGRIYSSFGARPDLTPGRFMYDLTHWRSEFSVTSTPCRIGRAPFQGPVMLPYSLTGKQGLDPLPPYRTVADFYAWKPMVTPTPLEYLSRPNVILEPKNPSPRHQAEVPAFDTLMVAWGGALPAQGPDPALDRIVNPVMTHYHGVECGPVTFTGFDLWTWSRADCQALVDAVLQGIWRLPKTATAPATARSTAP